LATSFAALAAPSGPTWTTEPSTVSSGRHCSTSDPEPPTKRVNVPDSASAKLPSTGASSSPTPAGRVEASRRTAAGPTVDIWTTVVVPVAPAAMPVGPSVTARSASGSETIVTTTSARRAASAGLAAETAPSAVSDSAFAGFRFHTTNS
jgi:hypothetical protein